MNELSKDEYRRIYCVINSVCARLRLVIAIKSLHIAKNVRQLLRRILTGTKSNTFKYVQVFLIGQLTKNYCKSR